LVVWSGVGEGAETKVDAVEGKIGLEGEGGEAEIFISNNYLVYRTFRTFQVLGRGSEW
jgi:hypothetical protein